MATRRRRTTAPQPNPAEEAKELTHEEILEVAQEREEANEVEVGEEASVETFLAMAAADTFEAIQKAEEEKGLDGFFNPPHYEVQEEIRLPAQVVPSRKKSPQRVRSFIPRNDLRRRKS